ncbi:hypothetical protein J7E68_01665 [Microbacterium sp. ISL-103]|uniref:hypothetical protein n=1 Tax=Microbacterium sp. ISL-103 TaxID=2819156 RepID=UPI001BE81FFE|nr:hypothetical protein [Microbacterium sp. ISL-103]MBT2473315.1 hypothetical protein [Microbacterium sp. ISL-103]
MAQLQAYVCNALTGQQLDRIPMKAYKYERLLSAGDASSSITIPLDGTFDAGTLRSLTQPWSRMIAIERDGVLEYMGYSMGHPGYRLGQRELTIKLVDLWSLLARRGGWNHSATNLEKWKVTYTASLAALADSVLRRGRTGPALPSMAFPLTLNGVPPGPAVTRSYYGYHMEYVADVLDDLMAEGLDIYFRPRWSGNGDADWLFETDIDWSTGITREFSVTAPGSPITGFVEQLDATRVTNNARYAGEGSEEDMLVRSSRKEASPYPLLDRVTNAKQIDKVAQLAAMAEQDLITYGMPTSQWEFQVTADTPIDVGDAVELHFDGDPVIPNGWYRRRVVKVSGDESEVKTISVQPTGGQ